jgi:hypothetical protein
MNLSILWLCPIVYAIHIIEEAPRFISWTRRYPQLFSSTYNKRMFILGNSIWMLYNVISVFLAITYPAQWSLVLGLSTASWIFSNAWLHIITTLSSGIYSPGVITASALYLPVSIFIYWSFWQQGILTPAITIRSILLGFAVMYLPILGIAISSRIKTFPWIVRKK